MTQEKIPQIFAQLCKVMESIGAIEKGPKDKVLKYSFRSIDDVYNAVQPALIAHQVMCFPFILKKESTSFKNANGKLKFRVELEIQYTFYTALDGSALVASVAGEGMDFGDKATNKAMSACIKYAFFQVLCIPTEEKQDSEYDDHQDNDEKGQPPEIIEPAPNFDRQLSIDLNEKYSSLNEEQQSALRLAFPILPKDRTREDKEEIIEYMGRLIKKV